MRFRRLVKAAFLKAGYRFERVRTQDGEGFNAQEVLFLRSGRSPRVILDVGACRGETVVRYGEIWPMSEIHSFEPFPGSFAALERSTVSHPKHYAYRLAMAETPGVRDLHVHKGNEMNSLLRIGESRKEHMGGELSDPVGSIRVDIVTLDSWCESVGIENIDILKMDVQGGELLVLGGAERMLASGRIAMIYCEVQFAPLYEDQAELGSLISHLRRRGYLLHGLYNLTVGTDCSLGFGDAIFLSAEMAGRLCGT